MKRFVLTLFFGVFCVYFECAQEKRALLLRVFVCVVNLFFPLYKCVEISIFSVEIFLQNIREMGEITIFDALWMYTEDTKKKRCAYQ